MPLTNTSKQPFGPRPAAIKSGITFCCKIIFSAILLNLLIANAQALPLQAQSISPQGEANQEIRQFSVRFNQDAVTAGNPAAPAPYTITCSGDNKNVKIPSYQGAWRNASTWVADFEDDLPPDLRCTARAARNFKSLTGEPIQPDFVHFETGAPTLQTIAPQDTISEDQIFVLHFNGAVEANSVQENSHCAIEGIGEQVPVRLVTGEAREAILPTLWFAKKAAKTPDHFVLLRCNRTLPAGADVALVLSRYRSMGGLTHSSTETMNFSVRPPFTASFSCTRNNAQADCLPIRPLTLLFNSPVPMEQVKQIRLKTPNATIAPTLSEKEAQEQSTQRVVFKDIFPERAHLQIILPANLQDDAGRSLSNAEDFPLTVQTAPMPLLAKFAAAPFGVIERFAEGEDAPALLPIALRKVGADLSLKDLRVGADLADLRIEDDADIIRWYRKLKHYHNDTVTRESAIKDGQQNLPPPLPPTKNLWRVDDSEIETRAISLLAQESSAKQLKVPPSPSDNTRPLELIGIALTPGFHVVELASPLLGEYLLNPDYGKERIFYTRTSALVTNLGVHFKNGRENALVWVTTLDEGKPVANARVAVSDCRGKLLASGNTNEQGIWQHDKPLFASGCYQFNNQQNDDDTYGALFVSARATDKTGQQDMAFVWSDWNRGIESWRFNVPTNIERSADLRVHSVLDRSLLRAGETLSMKHFIRQETLQGLSAVEKPPTTLRITHIGSGEKITMPLQWRTTASGGQTAQNTWNIAKTSKLGLYQISFIHNGRYGEEELPSGQFRVEAFRLPIMQGSITPTAQLPLIASRTLPIQVQLAYINGGAASDFDLTVSASARPGWIAFDQYEDFHFNKSERWHQQDDELETSHNKTHLLADHIPLKLDADGTARTTIEAIEHTTKPLDVTLEASYNDPNGEVQTLQNQQRIWPAAVVAGIKTEGWVSVDQSLRLQALALDTNGKPMQGVKLSVRAISHTTISSRKRLVGGFYSYDNQTDSRDLGTLCSALSDHQGLLMCEIALDSAGEVELIVSATDHAGKIAEASSSVTVTQQGEIWWAGEDHDRMDVLAEKRHYQPGEIAQFQVRMPFRQATALVTVEREGILHSEVVTLSGQDPTIKLKIQPQWGPNVYVSVLALRGRLYETPWYNIFAWGRKHEKHIPPTALIDLSKPAFRLGMAPIDVGIEQNQLQVHLTTDKKTFQVREQAQLKIQVNKPDGTPAAHAEVAVAAVDQALLALMPNQSWAILKALYKTRSWGVESASAQMEIIGRRHYGRKAVAAGGGGGSIATRELLDTLLLWQPAVVLDDNGQATLKIPLNDTLSDFQIVAIASSGQTLFGSGKTTIRTTQDLQIISALPPLVRSGDQFRARFTVRNTTAKKMTVVVNANSEMLDLAPQTVEIAAGAAQVVAWDVSVAPQFGATRQQEIFWHISARDQAGSEATDALKISQHIAPAVPLTVQQASLLQIDAERHLNIAPPPDSLTVHDQKVARGGVKVSLQSTLANGLPAVRDWFTAYPFTCLEQKASKAIGLNSATLWQKIIDELPAYLDADGLASYFPPPAGVNARGSDTLTAYLLAITDEAARLNSDLQLPAALRDTMLTGLKRFAEGKIERHFWSPNGAPQRDIRKISAIEALSRYGKADANMLSSIHIAPEQWPTHTIIDWYNILRRLQTSSQNKQQLANVERLLRTRLSYQGTRLLLNNERDDNWWWLMQNGDVNHARLIVTMLDNPAWQNDLPALISGLISRQQNGAWRTTTANMWGTLALEKFADRFEQEPPVGQTTIRLDAVSKHIDWPQAKRTTPPTSNNKSVQLAWQPTANNLPNVLTIQQQGSGKPWASIQALAAVPLKEPISAGFRIQKTISPIRVAQPNKISRGDIWRVRLDINAAADMTWVVLSDPIPGGASLLGSALGRDSMLATMDEKRYSSGSLAYIERNFEHWRAYYEYLPKGNSHIEYTLRFNNVGDFHLPPTRIEALYAPEIFAAAPNHKIKVEHQP